MGVSHRCVGFKTVCMPTGLNMGSPSTHFISVTLISGLTVSGCVKCWIFHIFSKENIFFTSTDRIWGSES